MNELNRKVNIFWLTLRIKYHRWIMDAEQGVTRQWKYHARLHVGLCKMRSELLTPTERRAIERREGLV